MYKLRGEGEFKREVDGYKAGSWHPGHSWRVVSSRASGTRLFQVSELREDESQESIVSHDSYSGTRVYIIYISKERKGKERKDAETWAIIILDYNYKMWYCLDSMLYYWYTLYKLEPFLPSFLLLFYAWTPLSGLWLNCVTTKIDLPSLLSNWRNSETF